MDNARQQIVDSLKANSNILVTVSTNPSVDELSAALGLTIILNNQDKRASAIFGGAIPPAIKFLEPEKTFEGSPDSLRDFIIALDKEKADHLRYKVEGEQVKIFITPYKTTLSQNDLVFSQGDYNVELVVALGVKNQDSLDKALEAHGKILHDATVVTITNGTDGSNLGSVDWHDSTASSLSEMVVSVADGLKTDKPIFDEQIATALLTGIVSATDRFSNEHTSSRTMTVAAQLMAAGANQQLIAAKLEEAHDIAPGAPLANTNDSEGDQSAEEGSELTIDRPGRTSSAKSAPKEESSEDLSQLELEKQLAGLASPSTGTMADIEKELQQAADEAANGAPAPEAIDTPSLIATSDNTMPGFEAPEPLKIEAATVPEAPDGESTPALTPEQPEPALEPIPAPEPVPAPELVIPEPAEPTPPPEIVQEHGPMITPDTQLSPINGTVDSPNEGEQTIDPFNVPITAQETPPLTPATNLGTPEGAALLASEPDLTMTPPPQAAPVEPAPAFEPAPAPPAAIPQLPPLPPLPTDGNLPPLPPPPPPPPTFQPEGPSLAGPVAGDVFGDGGAAPAAPAGPDPAPAPPEPGQFRIPGQ